MITPDEFYHACRHFEFATIARFLRQDHDNTYDRDGVICYGLVYFCERPWMMFTPAEWSKSCPAPTQRTSQIDYNDMTMGGVRADLLEACNKESTFHYACENRYHNLMHALAFVVEPDVLSAGFVTICEARNVEALTSLLDSIEPHNTGVLNDALRMASSKNYMEICSILKANTTIPVHPRYELYGACQGGYADRVATYPKKMLEACCKKCLLYAAEAGHLDVVKLAMGYGARNVNDALVGAARNNHMSVVIYLMGHGATHINNALAVSTTCAMVKFFVERGARPISVAYCMEWRNYAVKRYLIKTGLEDHTKVSVSDVRPLIRIGISLSWFMSNLTRFNAPLQTYLNALIVKKQAWDEIAARREIPAEVSWLIYEFIQ